ncbi:R3H domain-containing protein 1-like isoform X2 [Nelusetta ayraudi]
MRMSDTADTEATKVDGGGERTKSPSARDEPVNSKRDSAQSNTRLKLVRSLAVCEESFPSPAPQPPAAPQDGFLLQPSEKDERAAQDRAERDDDTNNHQQAEKVEKVPRKMLSRDSSQDYTDSTGIDLHEFLVNTLKGNPRDRIMLLKLEQEILDFISNKESQKRKFPPMTSYHRMLLHRVAAYFGMDHNVDPSGKSVVINKTSSTRIPDQKFCEHIKDDRTDDFQKRYILKRDNSSFDRDDSSIRMRLKADKRSKSMEEREEEYQRARDRIFAHDGDHFVLDRSAQDEDGCMSTQERRQMFRLRAGRSAASRQSSSSETETLARPGEPRPWSSTDSSDSSHRVAPPPRPQRPAMAKASSFSGVPGLGLLARGDSSASSSKSTGRLSKTGSESCSSVGSSSSSLSRPQLPLPAPPPAWSTVPSLPLIGPPPPPPSDAVKTVLPSQQQQPPNQEVANYYVLPLEASGILVGPHAGKSFIHSDSVVYSRNQQHGKSQQQPAANHLHSQPVCPPLQLSSEPLHHLHHHHHHPVLSCPLPPPPSQFLPVCPNQQFTVPDALNAHFSHMTLGGQQQQQQQHGEGGATAPDGRHYPAALYQTPPSSLVLQGAPPAPLLPPPQQQQQQQQQVADYMVAGPPGGHPGVLQGQPIPLQSPGLSHTYPALNLQLLQQQQQQQQHSYVQPPVQQMSACYCSSAQHLHCSTHQQHQQQQHYRSSIYNYPQNPNLPQQQVHQALLPNPASSGYQTLVGVQQPSPGGQPSNMGNQVQGVMVQYPPLQSYQVSVPPLPQQQQQAYQQPVFVSCQPGAQGPLAVAGVQPCYGLLPANQHTTMSSTVSFLPTQVMEQLQFPQTPPPCVSQQHPGQQYAGLLPPGPGGPGGGASVLMLQMAAPSSCPQPRAASPCQRKQPAQHKHSGPEQQQIQQQRGRRAAELALIADGTQSSLPLSPALTPSLPGQLSAVKGLPSGISSIPVLAHHHHHHLHQQQQHHHQQLHPQLPTAFCHSGQGDPHYSLLGQRLQYKPSIRPPLIQHAHMVAKHQGPLGVWRSGQGRRAGRKSLSSDLS